MGPIAALPALLAERGVSLGEACAGTGVAPDALDAEARHPFSALVALTERAAALARCPHLGLLIGARNDHRALGAVGEMMECAPTLGDALRDYVGLQIGYSRAAVTYLHRSGDDYLFGYGLYAAEAGLTRQVHDLVVAMACNMARALTGGRAQPLRALECVGAPDDLAPWRRALKTTALFDQEQTGIVLCARDMELALPGANEARRLQLRGAIRNMLRGDLEDTTAQVRHVLRPRLMLGEASRDSVARELGLSARTLARRLERDGASFEAIKDELRFTIARELLALTRLPVGRIGEALSYSAHSAFDHAFMRWSGATPSQWRAQRRPD